MICLLIFKKILSIRYFGKLFSSLILSRNFPVCLLFILFMFVHSFSMNAFLCLSFVVVSLQLPWLLIQNQVLEVHLGSSTIMDNGIMKILSNKCTAWFNSWFYAFGVFLGQHPTKTTADYFQWHQWSWLQIWLTFLALLSPIHEEHFWIFLSQGNQMPGPKHLLLNAGPNWPLCFLFCSSF